MADQDDDTRIYEVVMNHEEQYSILPAGRELPAGWIAVGHTGLKDECLAHIEKVWVDMRPLSLREYTKAFDSQRERSIPR
jgi:MbtH protein